MVVRLDTRQITDWDTFHDVFAQQFGFPGFYGRILTCGEGCNA